MNVYQAINAVQRALSKTGISKDHTNTQGATYKFRGIDDVYNAISPLLAEAGLCIIPRMISRTCEERQSNSGKALFYVTVEAEFDFVSAEDATRHTVRTFGEAMDSGDKATNKAMSAAYKYAALQTFAIPTAGDNDADASTHDVKSVRAPVRDGIGDDLPADWKTYLTDLAGEVTDLLVHQGAQAALDRIKRDNLDPDQYTYMFNKLSSSARAALKKAGSTTVTETV